jgi:hypothetical protein
MSAIDIFISHSSADEKVAKALIDLLRDAFHIESSRIRCTSVAGYKLKTGAHAETELRREVLQARVFIGILSEISLESAYVLFELGARWGTIQDYGYSGGFGSKNKIFPLLAAGATGSILRDPLKQYNALNCEKAADLHQLINDVGQEINQNPGNAAAYQDKIDTLIRVSRQLKGKRTKEANAKAAKTTATAHSPKTVAPKRKAVTKNKKTVIPKAQIDTTKKSLKRRGK